MDNWVTIISSWVVIYGFCMACLTIESEEKELQKKLEAKIKKEMKK